MDRFHKSYSSSLQLKPGGYMSPKQNPPEANWLLARLVLAGGTPTDSDGVCLGSNSVSFHMLILKELMNRKAQHSSRTGQEMTFKIYFLNPKNRILLRHTVASETAVTNGTDQKAFTWSDPVTFIRVELPCRTENKHFIHPADGNNKETLSLLWLVNIASVKHERRWTDVIVIRRRRAFEVLLTAQENTV